MGGDLSLSFTFSKKVKGKASIGYLDYLALSISLSSRSVSSQYHAITFEVLMLWQIEANNNSSFHHHKTRRREKSIAIKTPTRRTGS